MQRAPRLLWRTMSPPPSTPAEAPSRRVRDALLRIRPVLVALLVVAAAHGIAWAAITPPVSGPDELTHVAYVQSLVDAGQGPQAGGGTAQYNRELEILGEGLFVNPITQHYEGRPAWHRVDEVERELERLGDAARNDATGPNAAAANPPLYYLYASAGWQLTPDRSLLGRLESARVATVLAFLVTVVLAWLVAAELFAAAWARPIMAGIVALNPKLASIAANVNPDAFLVMIASAALLAALRLVRRGPSLGRVLALVALAAAGTLTHGRGYFLAPFALVVVAIALWRARDEVERRRLLALGGGAALVVIVGIGLATSWTRAHAAGAAFGGAAPGAGGFDPIEFASYVWQFYLPPVLGMEPFAPAGGYGYKQMFIASFFGGLVNLELHFSQGKYDVIQIVAFIAFIALLVTAAVRWRTVRARWPVVAVAVVFFLGMVALLHLVSYTSLSNGSGPVITGRYLLPAITLFAAAIAFLATSLPRPLGVALGGVALGLASLHAMAMLGFGVERFLA